MLAPSIKFFVEYSSRVKAISSRSWRPPTPPCFPGARGPGGGAFSRNHNNLTAPQRRGGVGSSMGTNMGRNGSNANNPMRSRLSSGWCIRHPLDDLGVGAGSALGHQRFERLDAAFELFIAHTLDATTVRDLQLARDQEHQELQENRRVVDHDLVDRLAAPTVERSMHLPDGVGVERSACASRINALPA